MLAPILWMLAGGAAGVIIAEICSALIVHPILAIFLKTARHTPLLFINGSLGFKGKVKGGGQFIHLRFASSSYATKFVELNPGATIWKGLLERVLG